MDSVAFERSENDIGCSLGVAKSVLRDARRCLVEGKHWAMVKGHVAYSDEGRKWLLFSLGLPDPDKLAEILDEEKPCEVVLARVTRLYRNSRIVGADFDGAQIRIKVRTN